MISQPFLLILALAYVLLLVLVAWWAERRPVTMGRLHPYIYSLALAVYCSSWTYFGAVGTAARTAWGYLPIYLGPILLFVFGMPLLKKLVTVGGDQKTTSIADFIGSRYGKRQLLAALVAVVAVVGSMPYIALQLKAVSLAWDTLAGPQSVDIATGFNIDNALITAVLLAIFSMIFGTRHLEGRERNRGMMAALAVESIVKLVALVLVAGVGLVVANRISGVDLYTERNVLEPWLTNPVDARFVTTTLLSMLAIICLPRQFHVTAVEYQHPSDLKKASWLFPMYLLVISFVVLPITLVGQQLFSGTGIAPDTYVLQLPMSQNMGLLTLIAFIGGFSAATGMVIVAVVTLSIMVSNEIVLPMMLRWSSKRYQTTIFLGRHLRWIRRVCILLLMIASWVMNRMIAQVEGLASIGLISFACFAQLAPALIGALYWRRAHAWGVYAGLAVGFFFWWFCLLLPSMLPATDPLLSDGVWGYAWLRPQALMGIDFLDPLSHGVFWSLASNILLYVGVSLLVKGEGKDYWQAEAYVKSGTPQLYDAGDTELSTIQVARLRQLLESFVSRSQFQELWRHCEERYRQRLLDDDKAPRFVVTSVEQALAGIIGAASAQSAIELLSRVDPLQISDIAAIVGDTSEQLQFNRDLLQTTVETVTQGICVVDASLKIVAWNHRYEELFDYPPRLLYVGCPIEAVYRFNAKRGMYREEESEERQVQRRLEYLRSGGSHRFERKLPNGTTIQVVGNPMPNGGFVTTYTDISDYKAVVDALEESKATLEERVQQRTEDLFAVNQALQDENRLRASAEENVREMHASKSRFMKAASHDLLQPISAARLFVSAMDYQLANQSDNTLRQQVTQVGKSLETAEQLVASLREIAGLESGKLQPNRTQFAIGPLMKGLASEFAMLAEQQGLAFRWVSCDCWVDSDPQILRRILQNFLSNAIHYTQRGRILFGCRRTREGLRVEIWDTGPGIAPQAMDRIFQEFERLNPGKTSADKGLGLGLTIADRMAELLGHRLGVRSWPGHGSVFSILLDYGRPTQSTSTQENNESQQADFNNCHVVCIDNEEAILQGLTQLLVQWGCRVSTASSVETLEQVVAGDAPDILLIDYHLHESFTGIDLLEKLPESWLDKPRILISADNSDEIFRIAGKHGFAFLSKPLSPQMLSVKMAELLGL